MRTSVLVGVVLFAALMGALSTPSVAQECQPDPGSVIANGRFDTDRCWNLFDPQHLVTTIFWSGSFYAQIAGNATYDAVQLIQLVPVEADVEYELSFTNWSVPDSTIVTIALQRDSDPYEMYGLWENVALDGSRVPIRFPCSTTDPAARFVIFLGHESPDTVTVSMGQLRLEPITCDQNNLVVNPTFDCEPAHPVGWQSYSSNPASVFETTSDAYHGTYAATLTDLPGTNYYDAYLSQDFIPWTANRWYIARYWQKGTGSGSSLLQMKNMDTGYTPVWIEFPVTADWAIAPFVFRPTESTENAQLKLFVGSVSGQWFVDPIQLAEVPVPDFSSVGSYEKGDFTGDGKDDLLYSENRDRRYLWVSRSNGSDYGPFELWGVWFGPLNGKLCVANFNGVDADSLRRDDVAIVASDAPALVRLSDGTAFVDPGTNPWTSNPITVPVNAALGGDFNGDGYGDIVTFTLGAQKDAYVLLGTGTSFLPPAFWNGYCGVDGEILFAADATGDGRDDIIAFVRQNDGHVFVGRSTGTSFLDGAMWAGLFCIHDRVPLVGDFNGDGKWDVAEARHGEQPGDDRKIFVRLSTGSGLTAITQWHGYFGGRTDLLGSGDFNGDGLADLVALEPDWDFWFTQSWGGNFGDVLKWYAVQEDLPFIPPLEEPDAPPTGAADDIRHIPSGMTMRNFPSPFGDATTIAYTIPSASKVHIAVYDVSGRQVATLFNGPAIPGSHEVSWRPAKDISSGIYFARVQAGSATAAKKLIVLR